MQSLQNICTQQNSNGRRPLTTPRQRIEFIHAYVQRALGDAGYWMSRLETEHDAGWHPEALPMVQLEADARELTKLAERIAALRQRMIKQGEVV